jgi:hypothetical protein
MEYLHKIFTSPFAFAVLVTARGSSKTDTTRERHWATPKTALFLPSPTFARVRPEGAVVICSAIF